jgi:hypothetical protein
VSSSVGAPEVPMSDAPPMSNGITDGGGAKTDEVRDINLKRALAAFAKPKLRPFWLKGHLTDDTYRHVLGDFVNDVARSLQSCGPQTPEEINDFIKQEDKSLRNRLKVHINGPPFFFAFKLINPIHLLSP